MAMRGAVVHIFLCTALLAMSAQEPNSSFDCKEQVPLTTWKGDEEHPRRVAVHSPDGSKIFAVRPGPARTPIVTITDKGKPVRHDVHYISQARLLWSPASNAFLIESTCCGSYDGWTLQVFVFNANRVEEFDVDAEARKDLGHSFPRCVPGDPLNVNVKCDADWGDSHEFNVFALKWLTGDRLLIAVEIPCSTSYGPNWCKMKAYEVEVPTGRILAAYTHAEAHHRYPTLVSPEKSHMIGLTGWVKIEGDKTLFISDEDEQKWIVSNPETLKGHERHHVDVQGRIILEDNSLEITTAKMVDEAEHDDVNKR